MTSLPNRISLYARLAVEIDKVGEVDRTLAIHCIDLDRLKEVNESFGHNVGDEIIEIAGQRLGAAAGETCFLARISGDEFVILQPRVTWLEAQALAARLCAVIADPFDLNSGRVFTGCSIGIALAESRDLDPSEVLRHADLALYRAKADGRGRYCFFDPEMDEALKRSRMLEADLREAIANDELTMAYQPQVDANGNMIGVEALMRWHHNEGAWIPPTVFIPLAEERGLISELGMLAFRKVFATAGAWPGIKIAVNVSAIQLRALDFVPQLKDLVASFELDPRQFEIEITEGILLGDNPSILKTLAELRAIGFSIALDDFGTGYSSLSYLRKYPVDKIKIDRAFVATLGQDGVANALVGAIIMLARALGLSVIAEGVETEDQRSRLASAGCEDFQGYLYSCPVPPAEITDIIKSIALKDSVATPATVGRPPSSGKCRTCHLSISAPGHAFTDQGNRTTAPAMVAANMA